MGKKALIDIDNGQKKDIFGRVLAEVYCENKSLNKNLMKNHLAIILIKYCNVSEFRNKSWAYNWCNNIKSPHYGCLKVIEFNYNPPGDDNLNLTNEFFVIKNICNYTIKAKYWYVIDSYRNFCIISFNLKPNGALKIVTGKGKNSNNTVFCNYSYAIWNNNQDTLYIRDSTGRLVLKYSYVSAG